MLQSGLADNLSRNMWSGIRASTAMLIHVWWIKNARECPGSATCSSIPPRDFSRNILAICRKVACEIHSSLKYSSFVCPSRILPQVHPFPKSLLCSQEIKIEVLSLTFGQTVFAVCSRSNSFLFPVLLDSHFPEIDGSGKSRKTLDALLCNHYSLDDHRVSFN